MLSILVRQAFASFTAFSARKERQNFARMKHAAGNRANRLRQLRPDVARILLFYGLIRIWSLQWAVCYLHRERL